MDIYDAMAKVGLAPPLGVEIVMDGLLHRYRVDGEKLGSQNGWYVCFPTAGVFGSWRTDQKEVVWFDEKPSTPERINAFRQQVSEAKRLAEKERWQQHCTAADECRRKFYSGALELEDHSYLIKKAVRPYGVRVRNGVLMIPLQDVDGKLWSLQYIYLDGKKRFAKGGRITGCFHRIGDEFDPEGIIVIVEGYATGATIYENTGYPTFVAFNAGNLEAVALILRHKYPKARIVFAADNDNHLELNIGLMKAKAAAKAVGGIVVYPRFSAGNTGTDWNDLLTGK
ncbi:toprim domain-containing protein [Sansalvadorimonas verongulae]|uniref:toprim domain-containing protein n=1 Tax=Sansalvadorimonas verongulae TaxID=2172824 RepID=UPI0018AD1BC5|nr:toprim domain-containing protein [Sansalvadorimonas verongulae]